MTLKQRWATGRQTVGVWNCLDDPVTAEILGRSGFDFVVTDLQHGFVTMPSATQILNALHNTPASPVIRVPWNTPELIMRALDLGAEAVIIPMVNTVEEAEQAAAACRYAPAGGRSWGPLWSVPRGSMIKPDDGDQVSTCIVMIETREALQNLTKIARVPGIDAVYVGPNDLALSLGLGQVRPEQSALLEAAIEGIIIEAKSAGIAAGVDCLDLTEARHWCERGADLMIIDSDSRALARGTAEAATAAHAMTSG